MVVSNNRFDFLRLLFASVVFIYHAVVLAALDAGGAWEAHLALGAELSIQGFFVISGALVYGSWERSRGLADYTGKRVRRLYPAYLVIILIPALVSLALTFDIAGVGKYLAANAVFLNFLAPDLPGLFEGQRFAEVNGALWTLKIEVMFYIALPVLAWGLGKLGRYWWVGVGILVAGAFAWVALMAAWAHPLSAQAARQLPGQMMYFGAGMALWRLWPLVKAQAGVLFLVGLAALVLSLSFEALAALRVLGLAGLIAGIAFGPGPAVNAARWGDVSYGVYIVHFPVVQAFVALGIFGALGAVGGLIASAVVVFGLSFALWWFVEKPALRRDSHYRRVSEQE
jgi:peptidoglycan/LPS O-acetylase OafA/YrhL